MSVSFLFHQKDVWFTILSFLHPKELLYSVMLVSKYLKQVVRDDRCWNATHKARVIKRLPALSDIFNRYYRTKPTWQIFSFLLGNPGLCVYLGKAIHLPVGVIKSLLAAMHQTKHDSHVKHVTLCMVDDTIIKNAEVCTYTGSNYYDIIFRFDFVSSMIKTINGPHDDQNMMNRSLEFTRIINGCDEKKKRDISEINDMY